MARGWQGPKDPPAAVARDIVEALRGGVEEIYPGAMAQGIAAGLAADARAVERQFAGYVP
jgi:hypothetical protein